MRDMVSQNNVAVIFMLVSVFGYSLLPLGIALSGGGESPFLTSLSIRFGSFIGNLSFLLLFYRALVFNSRVWALIKQRLFCLPVLLLAVAHFDYVFYIWSTRFLDVSVAAVIFETWPILLIVLVGWLFRRDDRYGEITPSMLVLLAFSYAGFSFVILSQVEEARVLQYSVGLAALMVASVAVLVSARAAIFGLWNWVGRAASGIWSRYATWPRSYVDILFVAGFLSSSLGVLGGTYFVLSYVEELGSSWRLAAGMGLVLIALAVTSLASFGFKWGADFGAELMGEVRSGGELSPLRLPHWMEGRREETGTSTSLELFGVVVVFLICNLSTMVITAIMGGVVVQESVTLDMFLVAVFTGVISVAVGGLAWRFANLSTNNLGVNSLAYLTPVLALAWLFLYSQVNVPKVDFLIIGTAVVIIANMLINFEAEIRLGFKSLIVALWVCGMVVYLRDGIGGYLNVDGWSWSGTEVYYFDALILLSTVFILILSFRVARLVTRTSDEENRLFTLFQKLDLLAERGTIDEDVREHILDIDVSEQRPRELERAYFGVIDRIQEAKARCDSDHEDRGKLAEVEAELNALVHSKRQGIVFGELFALYIFAGVSVLIVLFARPSVSTCWTGFLLEVFSTAFPAVIIFLLANVHDLQSERVAAVLGGVRESGYRVLFLDIRNRASERWIFHRCRSCPHNGVCGPTVG